MPKPVPPAPQAGKRPFTAKRKDTGAAVTPIRLAIKKAEEKKRPVPKVRTEATDTTRAPKRQDTTEQYARAAVGARAFEDAQIKGLNKRRAAGEKIPDDSRYELTPIGYAQPGPKRVPDKPLIPKARANSAARTLDAAYESANQQAWEEQQAEQDRKAAAARRKKGV